MNLKELTKERGVLTGEEIAMVERRLLFMLTNHSDCDRDRLLDIMISVTILKKALAGCFKAVIMTLDKPNRGFGNIRVRGKSITILDTKAFQLVVDSCDVIGATPLINGELDLDFGFYGLKKETIKNELFQGVHKQANTFETRGEHENTVNSPDKILKQISLAMDTEFTIDMQREIITQIAITS